MHRASRPILSSSPPASSTAGPNLTAPGYYRARQLVRAERITNEWRDKLAAENHPCKLIFVTPDYYEERPKACMNSWGNLFTDITPDGTACPVTARGNCR